MLYRIELKGVPESAGRARRFVRDVLGADHPALESVEVCTSELVTNSVVHSDSRDGGEIILILEDDLVTVGDPPAVGVTVIDQGSASKPRVGGECPDGRLAESDRGLFIVSRYATRWGFDQPCRGMTVTWFLVRFSAPPSPGST